ncbi:MAG: TonB-dependent [Prolixibacteraceae bacterium]|nr:MAG: TonB-dependent [Prolixibacteraceae bacterium]
MKNYAIHLRLDKEYVNEIIRIMKLMVFFILMTIYSVSGSKSYSQDAKLSIHLQNANILELVNAIENQSEYIFLYKDDVQELAKNVSVDATDKTLDEIMSSVSEKLSIKYKINDRQVIISVNQNLKALNDSNSSPTISKQKEKGKGTIYGRVTEAENGKPMPFVAVIVNGTVIGTTTDASGNYVLAGITEGNQVIVFSFLGFEKTEKPITIDSDQKIEVNVALKTMVIQFSEIIVTKQVKGQMKAINQQLNASEIMNAVSAERIQELPDANAAETVARLPGVSLQREGGEGNKLVIRGLEPKYNRISIEGVSMASTGGNDRSVDISMISPYSLDGIEVTKAITADKDADYMGGSVNFKLRKAEPNLKSSIIAQGGYNNLRNVISNYMLVGNLGNRFIDDKLGVYFQGNIEKRNLSSNDLNATFGHFNSNPQIGQNNVLTTGGLYMVDNYRNRNRYGATLVIDYKLPQGSIQFNNLFNQSITTNNSFTEIYTSGRTHEYDSGDSKNKLLTLTNVLDYLQQLGNFEIGIKVSHSLSNNNTPKAINFHYVQNGGLSSEAFLKPVSPEELLDYKTINDLNANWTTVSKGSGLSKQSQWESAFNLKYDFVINNNIKGNIKGGFKYRYLTNFFDYDVHSGSMNLGSAVAERDAILNAFPWMQEIVPLGSEKIPYYLFIDKSGNQDLFLDGKYEMGPHANIPLMNQILDILTQTTQNQTGISEAYHYNDMMSNTLDYEGKESLLASYLMTEINVGKSILLIPGVRFEKNTTNYTAPRGDSSLPFPDFKYVREEITVVKSDQFLLPMVHLKYSPVKGFNIRLAYTETLSRPNYNLITPRWDIGSQIIQWNNYGLQPEHSRNWDAYFSFFSGKLGLFTIGGFTKDITNKIFVMDRRVVLDPSVYDIPNTTKDKFIFTQMNNPNVSNVKGMELDWQTAFWYLPGALKGLIFNMNYSWIFSEAEYPYTVVESTWDPDNFEYSYKNLDSYYVAPLVFQPKHILNLSFGYDYENFSARISMLYKDKVFQGPNFWPELVNYSDAYVRWDMSIKQGLPWYGMQVFCNLNNITNTKDVIRNIGSGYANTLQHYGSTIDIGIRLNIDYSKNTN